MKVVLFGVHLSPGVLRFSEVQATLAHLGAFAVSWAVVSRVLSANCPYQPIVCLAATVLGAIALILASRRRFSSGLPAAPFETQFRLVPHAKNVRFSSKFLQRLSCPLHTQRPVAVVTGGNSGIGFWNAFELASLGFDVILCCRSRERAEAAIASITARCITEHAAAVAQLPRDVASQLIGFLSPGRVSFVPLDLGNQRSIETSAAEVARRSASSLAIVVNNAGMYSPVKNRRCSFGNEELLGVNYLGVVMFIEKLLQHVHQIDGPERFRAHELRIVNVSSIAHLWASIPRPVTAAEESRLRPSPVVGLETLLRFPGAVVDVNTYGLAKLLLIMYTRARSASLSSTFGKTHRVTMVAVHPGAVLTDVFRELGWLARAMPFLLRSIFKTPREGAEPALFAALSDEVVGGRFYADLNCMDDVVSSWADDSAMCRQVLQLTLDRWSLNPCWMD